MSKLENQRNDYEKILFIHYQRRSDDSYWWCFFLTSGLAIIVLSVVFLPFAIMKILGASLGIMIMSVASFAEQAQGLGAKPFTNDPLGWRKAKLTYIEETSEDALPKRSSFGSGSNTTESEKTDP